MISVGHSRLLRIGLSKRQNWCFPYCRQARRAAKRSALNKNQETSPSGPDYPACQRLLFRLTLDLTPGFILVAMEGTIHIGEAGKLAGVTVDTIRFYQRQGLIPATPRSAGGYRLFGEEQIRDLTFVKHAQELGFSLHEIKELLSLRQSRHVCPGVQSLLERKLEDVHDKIRRLVHMERELSRELRNCKKELRMKGSVRHEECCPLIEKLEQEDGRHAKSRNATRK